MYHYKVVTRGSLPPNPCDDQLLSYFHEMNTFSPDYGSSWGLASFVVVGQSQQKSYAAQAELAASEPHRWRSSSKVSRSVNKSDTVANIRIVTSLTSSRVSKNASGGFWGKLLL
jgi:hypothetical protein